MFREKRFKEHPSLKRNDKYTCENCGMQTTRVNCARHKKAVQLEYLIVVYVPTYQHVRKLI